MKRSFQTKTKLDKKGKEHITQVVMDYTNCTVDDLIGPAEDSLIITLQGRWRRAKSIPPKIEVKVKELVATLGKRMVQVSTPEGLKSAFDGMSPEDKAKFMEALKASMSPAPEESE